MRQLTVVLTLLQLLLPGLSEARSVVLLTSEAAPYVFGPGASRPGLAAEIVEAAFSASGYTVQLVHAGWSEIAHQLGRGDRPAAFPFTLTRERREYADFSEPFLISRTVLFSLCGTHTGPSALTTFASFQPPHWGVEPGDRCTQVLRRVLGARLHPVNGTGEALQALLDGEVNYVPMDQMTGRHLLADACPQTGQCFVSSFHALEERGLHVMFSRQHPAAQELRQAFNEGLERIRRSGTLASILMAYPASECRGCTY